jgi:C4-dicarboxylate-specific signal transduction histidine kinase
MGTLVDEVIELLNGPITNRGVKIVINGDFPIVKADRSRIQEVLQNLIENAIKFMGDQKDPEITIGYLPGKGENIFFVRDNGMGIESVYLGKNLWLLEQWTLP